MSKKSPLYTKSGDSGETGLVGGARTSKDSDLIEAIGAVDELNAILGTVLAFGCAKSSTSGRLIIKDIQGDLFYLGAELASCFAKQACNKISEKNVEKLEKHIDDLDALLPPLKNFILPGGGTVGSMLHMGRAVCRRAERSIIRLLKAKKSKLNPTLIKYINRLSDLLFVLARYENKTAKRKEVAWRG